MIGSADDEWVPVGRVCRRGRSQYFSCRLPVPTNTHTNRSTLNHHRHHHCHRHRDDVRRIREPAKNRPSTTVSRLVMPPAVRRLCLGTIMFELPHSMWDCWVWDNNGALIVRVIDMVKGPFIDLSYTSIVNISGYILQYFLIELRCDIRRFMWYCKNALNYMLSFLITFKL